MIEGTIRYCPQCRTELIPQLHTGKLRPSCPKCGWIYFPDPKVAVIVLIKHDDQILLAQRMFEPQRGKWTLPSGYVDAGEDPRAAAERECMEETGLKIGNIRLLDVIFSQEYPRGASILLLYQADVQSGELKASDDANQVAYFKLDNLPPLAFESTKWIISLFY